MLSRETIFDSLFQEETVECNGVTFTIQPLPAYKAVKIQGDLFNFGELMESGDVVGSIIAKLGSSIMEALNECVTVQGLETDQKILVEELPLNVIPDLLSIFQKQSFDLGKWGALVREIAGGLGLERLVVSWLEGLKSRVSQAVEMPIEN